MLTITEIDQLEAGDVVKRTGSGTSFLTKGRSYELKEGILGLYLIDDTGDRYGIDFLRTNRERWTLVEKRDTNFPFHIDNISLGESPLEVTVITDRAGLARLREIEEEVKKRSELKKLRQQREELDAKIKELEGDD